VINKKSDKINPGHFDLRQPQVEKKSSNLTNTGKKRLTDI